MASAQYFPEDLAELDRHLRAMIRASNAAEIVAAVEAFLASWSTERVERLQTMDAGWAPFDERQHPLTVCDATDVRRVCVSLHGQCEGLKAAGVALTPELLEMDLFFFFAGLALDRVEPIGGAWAGASRVGLPPRRQALDSRQ